MADTMIPYGRNLPSVQTESFTDQELFTGDFPVHNTQETVDATTIAAAALPAFSVVGRNASGDIVPAVLGTTEAIGITAHEVPLGATTPSVVVHRSGVFNPNALTWDSTYDTDEKKRTAFEELQPTIFIQKPVY